MSLIVSPDCRDQNHQKCPGDAWDETHDHGTECKCTCHSPADPRIEAAARGIWQWHEENAASNSTEPTHSDIELAIAALVAADAVDTLRQPGHRVEIKQFSWTLQHPPECRPNMLACPMTQALQRLGVSGIDDGTYAVELTGDGSLFFAGEVTP